MKPGKDFEKRLRARLEQAGCYVQKLADAPGAFIGRPDLNEAQSSFTPQNPYDLVVLRQAGTNDRGAPLFEAFAIEAKSTSLPRFPLEMVKDHQQKGLRRFPGVAGVVVELRKTADCFFVPIDVIDKWTSKKSMNISDLEAVAVRLPRNTSGRERLDYYDVMPLLKEIR